jgi:hypothetical protein
MVYILISYFLRHSFWSKQPIEETKSLPDFERHIAIIFDNYIKEDQLLLQVQWLLKQDYKNFSAYFFCSDPIVEFNGLQNITILTTQQIPNGQRDLSLLVKKYSPNLPSKIVCVKSKTNLPYDFLFKQNEALFYGNNSQAYINLDTTSENFTKSSFKKLQKYLSAKMEAINSLIENSNKKEGLSLVKINSNIHFVLGILIIFSFTLIGINRLEYMSKSIFDYISLTGIIASAIIIINVALSKKWKRFESRRQFS